MTKPDKRSLTGKQLAFIDAYMVDRNATKAAIKAKYSKKTAKEMGHENLTKPHIRDEIARRHGVQVEKTERTHQSIIADLEENFRLARELDTPNIPASTKCLELIGKHIGMWPVGGPQKVEEEFKDRPPTDNPALLALVLEMEEEAKRRWAMPAKAPNTNGNGHANGNGATVINGKNGKVN